MSAVIVQMKPGNNDTGGASRSRPGRKAGKPDRWMPLHIGDYLADTTELTTMEHGAYLLLLMSHWRMGFLPDDDVKLARIAKLRLDHWRKIAPTIRAFFQPGAEAGTIVQKRLREELARATDVAEKRAEAARVRWENQEATTRGNGGGDQQAKSLKTPDSVGANARILQMPGTAQATSDKEQEEKEVPPHAPRRRGAGRDRSRDYTVDFEMFWDEYPNKEKKPYAFSCWTAALKRGVSVQSIMAHLEADKAGRWVGRPPDKIPHPSTWLNNDPWDRASALDAPAAGPLFGDVGHDR